MKRRDFLKRTIGTGLATSSALWQSPFNLFFREAQAQALALPVLIVVFQRGGCDGLNMVVPYGDPFYSGLRPTIAIEPPDPTNADAALDLDGFYGLQPNLASLLPIFQAGNMAILPAVQYPTPSRSHFDSQNFIESGIRADDYDGWLNRFLAVTAQASQLRAVHFGGSLAQALRGNVPVSSFSSLGNFNLGLSDAEETVLIDHVLPIYEQAPSPPTSLRQLVQDFGQVLFGNLDVVNAIDTSTYVPANNAVYPNSTYGRQLREVAQLIKTPSAGLQIATINIGGWDTHSNQGGGEPEGRQSGRFRDFANGIAALNTDLGGLMDRVCILSMTEFGRTCKENGSLGTDHGIGCVWTLISNLINGGMYPDATGWPGLSDQDLVSGRFLQFTTDYRDIMGDVLSAHLGVGSPALDVILPQHAYTPLGLFA